MAQERSSIGQLRRCLVPGGKSPGGKTRRATIASLLLCLVLLAVTASPAEAVDYVNDELLPFYTSNYSLLLYGGTLGHPATYLLTDEYRILAPDDGSTMGASIVIGSSYDVSGNLISTDARSYNTFIITEGGEFPYAFNINIGNAENANYNTLILKGDVRGQGINPSQTGADYDYFGGAFTSVGGTGSSNNGSYNSLILCEGAKFLGRILSVGVVGGERNSVGNLLEITGPGSEMQITDMGGFTVSAGNRVMISDGGKLLITSTGIYACMDGEIIVTGAGSEFTSSYAAISGAVRISEGGRFQSDSVGGRKLGLTSAVYDLSDGGTMEVSGAFYSQGTLALRDASLSAGSLVTSGQASARAGSLIEAASLTNSGTLLIEDSVVRAGSLTSTGNGLEVGSGGLLAVADSLTFDTLRIHEGFVAWEGDHIAGFEALIAEGKFQLMDSSGVWHTVTDSSMFQVEYFADPAADSSELTGGLYTELGGYTVLTAVPEPSSLALTGLGGLLLWLRRRRQAFRRAVFPLAFLLAGQLLQGQDYVNGEIDSPWMEDGEYLLTGGYASDFSAWSVYVGQTWGWNSLTIENGATLTSIDAGIGMSSSRNAAVVSGTGSSWRASGTLYVGKRGAGGNSLTITDGGSVSATYGSVGVQWLRVTENGETIVQSADNNSITVADTGSTLSIQASLTIGDAGLSNRMVIRDGAGVSSGSGIIGNLDTATGNSVEVSTAGQWTVNRELAVGNMGTGNTLSVLQGGRVTSRAGVIGKSLGGSGNSATVDGAGSAWIVAETLVIGARGFGNHLVVSGGGAVTSGSASIGSDAGFFVSTGNTAAVTGAGSTWNTGTLALYGENSLSITDGGLVLINSSSPASLSINGEAFIQIDGGYLAWEGDQASTFAAMIETGAFCVHDEEGQWITAKDISLFSITATEAGDDTSGLTNGLYADLGGKTILGLSEEASLLGITGLRIGAMSVVPEPGTLALVTLALGSMLGRFARRDTVRRDAGKPRTSNGGFTLVELLASVSILAILAAVLMPLADSFLASAAQGQSIGNLKQFGVAYQQYAADHETRLPPAICVVDPGDLEKYGFDENAYRKAWDYFLLPYLGYESGPGLADVTNANRPRGASVENLFMHRRDKNTGTRGSRRTYAANSVGATPVFSSVIGSGTVRVWTRMLSIKRPSRLIILSEFPNSKGIVAKGDCGALTPGIQIALTTGQHPLNPGGRYNYLFLDGHVESLKLEQTYRPTDSYPAENGGPTPPAGKGEDDLWRDENLVYNGTTQCPFAQQGWR